MSQRTKYRKDSKGYVLYKHEYQRSDGSYCYQYTDAFGRRPCIYAPTLAKLRKREEEIKNLEYKGIDYQELKRVTLNNIVDRYLGLKYSLEVNTLNNYRRMYDKYIRNDYGRMKIASIQYSTIKKLYYMLYKEKGLEIGTIETINNVIGPAYRMAIRDNLLSSNPTVGVIGEIKREVKWVKKKREALTEEQQVAFFQYLSTMPKMRQWYLFFLVMIGTGMRQGEICGLCVENVDFDKNLIRVEHSVKYVKDPKTAKCRYCIGTTKTQAGIRTIPLLDVVRDALTEQMKVNEVLRKRNVPIDGHKDIIFTSRTGHPYKNDYVNRILKQIREDYNEQETAQAKQEGREPVLIPPFTSHVLRHSFCSRMCENGVNMKLVQKIMGHTDIKVTMNLYADISQSKEVELFQDLNGVIRYRN